jgi:zinc D-Ala-D-Ala carboxypeptidase
MQSYKYFKREEFSCDCCGDNLMVDSFIEMLDKAREIAGIPFKINSGYRCVEHNKKSKRSSATSSHLKGIAADIECLNGIGRYAIVMALKEVGINRIGIADTFIHADIDITKPQGTIWLY